MNRPPRPILAAVNAAAWLADRALTHLVPSAPRHVLEAENARLRRDLHTASDLADSLAKANDELNRELDDAADTVADYWLAERVQENARIWMHDHGISEEWLDLEVDA